MKLLYATSLTFPSGLANRLQILAMSKEFQQRLGKNFVLGVGRVGKHSDIQQKVPYIHTLNEVRSFKLAWKYLLYAKKHDITHIYCREPRLLFFLDLYNRIFFRLNVKFIYECHAMLDATRIDVLVNRYIARRLHRIFFLTQALQNKFHEKFSRGNSVKSYIAPDGVHKDIFDIPVTKDDARSQRDLPADAFIVGYFGRFKTLGMEKGVGPSIEALTHLPENVILLAMGGKKVNQDFYGAYAEEQGVSDRVIFVEHFSQDILAIYQKACDALLMPFPHTDHYAYYMSPLKMFEYMAATRPIISTTLPSIKEVLEDGTNALLVQPGDAEALAQAIQTLHDSPDIGQKLSEQAYRDVDAYDWGTRADSILKSL